VPEATGESWLFEIIMGTQYDGVPDPPYGGQTLFIEIVEEPVDVEADVTVTVVVTVLF